ncbi:hypothetical protein MFRU_008g02930 [Monilinia fructicola]|nr:hypothetical protein MFRU_008g02930 [Monilinia fructicola]
MTVYMADNYNQPQMIGLGIGFIVLPIFAVVLRLWAKWIGRRSIQLDDYLILVAMAFAIGCCSVQLVAAIKGGLGQHQVVDANGQPILDDPKFVTYEKCKFAVNMLSTIGLGFTKASILILYMNIFRGHTFHLASQAMMALVITWSVSFFFANLFTCYPITPFVEPFYNHKCMRALDMWYAMSVSDIVVDIMILALPVPMVWQLKLRVKQKVGVLLMFLLGATVCAFSVTRMVAYFHVGGGFLAHYNDETYYTSPVFFWANIELSSAILCVSLPTYRPIWLSLSRQPLSATASHQLSDYPTQKRSDGSANSKWGISGSHGSQRLRSETDSVKELSLGKGVDGTVYAVATHIDGGSDGYAESGKFPQEGISVEHEVRIEERC